MQNKGSTFSLYVLGPTKHLLSFPSMCVFLVTFLRIILIELFFFFFFFRYAVVTGANKGIGLETVKGLASNGIKVVLTARDVKRGYQAVEELKREFGFSDLVVFHQLDVTDPSSVASLVEFVKIKFGRLDILV